MSVAEIKHEIRKLPVEERVELLEELWREAERERPDLYDWQRQLLDERLADARVDPDDWVSWDAARRRLDELAGR